LTPEQKLDKYYLKKFGWSLAEVNAMFAAQENVCAACKRPPGERRMSVDHDHWYDRLKIAVHKVNMVQGKLWIAYCKELEITSSDPDRKRAKETVRIYLRKLSVRGGLCLRCNRGLALFEDSKAPVLPAERLERLAQYLRRFNQREAP
jgi:hypothetical protein